MNTPTLINLPPPPSNPETPSDIPGTPNSTTTSLSALSTTAIKDGHRGQAYHSHQHHSSGSGLNSLDAERADRISRLAGLERVSTGRLQSGLSPHHPSNVNPDVAWNLAKERSTVGSASATEPSIGARTTWASSSEAYDQDKMSEDPDDGISSIGGFSDEGNASLVGFGEGASGISGPLSTSHQRTLVARPYSSIENPAIKTSPESHRSRDMRMIDGMTYDSGVTDTTTRTPLPASPCGNTDEDKDGNHVRGKGPFGKNEE